MLKRPNKRSDYPYIRWQRIPSFCSINRMNLNFFKTIMWCSCCSNKFFVFINWSLFINLDLVFWIWIPVVMVTKMYRIFFVNICFCVLETILYLWYKNKNKLKIKARTVISSNFKSTKFKHFWRLRSSTLWGGGGAYNATRPPSCYTQPLRVLGAWFQPSPPIQKTLRGP